MEISGRIILQRIRGYLPGGVSLPDFCGRIGIAASTVYSWGANNTIPKADDLLRVADALGVSMRLLLTGNDEVGLTPEEAELLRLYRSLPAHDKRLVLSLARQAGMSH